MHKDDDDDEHSQSVIPWETLAPLLAWMTSNRIERLRLVAQPAASPVAAGAAYREESAYFFHCENEPDSPGLLNIYAVTDEDGHARFNGPSSVPSSVLRPVLRALDEASVSEFSISTVDAEAQSAGLDVAVDVTLADIEEHEEPRQEAWSPVIIAVRVI